MQSSLGSLRTSACTFVFFRPCSGCLGFARRLLSGHAGLQYPQLRPWTPGEIETASQQVFGLPNWAQASELLHERMGTILLMMLTLASDRPYSALESSCFASASLCWSGPNPFCSLGQAAKFNRHVSFSTPAAAAKSAPTRQAVCTEGPV